MCGDEGKRSVKGRMNQTINRYYIYQGAHSEFLCITQADSTHPPPTPTTHTPHMLPRTADTDDNTDQINKRTAWTS